MKVIQALPQMSKPVTEDEVVHFLESRLNMQLATIDKDGYPVIQPLWFIYDKETEMIYSGTNKMSRKVDNIMQRPDRIYFSIDDENSPPKGVKGRGAGSLSLDVAKNAAIIDRLNRKYLGTAEHPLARTLIESARNGTEIVIEIKPSFFSAWDYGKGT